MIFKIFDAFNECGISACHKRDDSIIPLFASHFLALLSPESLQHQRKPARGSAPADEYPSAILQALVDIFVHVLQFWYLLLQYFHCDDVQLLDAINAGFEVIFGKIGQPDGEGVLLLG